jgi:hypothetical protein
MIDLKLTVCGTYKGKRYTEDVLRMGQFQKFLGDWKPAFRFIAHDIVEPFIVRQFETEGKIGDEAREGWQELAESTLKSRRFPGLPIPHETGDLLDSFLEGGGDHVEEISAKKMVWGSGERTSLFFQSGTGKGFGKTRVQTGPGTGRGMTMRKELVIHKRRTNDIMLTMQARLMQVARMVGYGVMGRGATALEARMAGVARMGAWLG